MKNFLLQTEFFPDGDQARVTLTPIKPGARVIVEDVAWNDAYQTACKLLDEAFGVRKPDRDRMLFDGVIGETEAAALNDRKRWDTDQPVPGA